MWLRRRHWFVEGFLLLGSNGKDVILKYCIPIASRLQCSAEISLRLPCWYMYLARRLAQELFWQSSLPLPICCIFRS
jgi:hypothetical protein